MAVLLAAGSAAANVGHLSIAKTVDNVQPVELQNGLIKKGRSVDLQSLSAAGHGVRQKAVADSHGVITNPPGTAVNYMKSCEGYYMLFGSWLEPYKAGAIQSTIVEDGNEVYFLDILNNADFGSYVKGIRLGNQITVNLPQTLAYEEVDGDLPLVVTLNVLKLGEIFDEYGEGWSYFPDNTITSVTYTQQDDGSWALDLPGAEYDGSTPREYALGLVDAEYGDWIGYCDFRQTYEAFDEVPVTMPEDLPTETYNCVNGIYGYPVEVALQGNDIYIKGLCTYLPEFTIKASIEGDKAVVPRGQFIGMYEAYYIFTLCGTKNPKYVEWDPFSPEYLINDKDFIFDYDAEAHSLKSSDPDLYLLFNSGTETLNYMDAFNGLNILQQDSYAGVPANPFALYWTPFLYEYYGYCSFNFELPMISTTGDLLDSDCLFYSIFVDGEVMTFVNDEDNYVYHGIEGATTLIPATLNNDWDFYLSSPTYHQIGIYTKDVETVGVQSIYIYNGTTTMSARVTFNVKTGDVTVEETGVADVVNDSKVVSEEYYTITGQRVVNPTDGLYIVRKIHDNGASTVTKQIIR